MINIFQSQSLRFEYVSYEESEENTLALQDINIHIEQGEFVAVLGHNGSGKSTLARHLNALLAPTSGTLWVKGMDSKEAKNAWLIRQVAGMVFQNPDNQLVATIVEEDVAFGPENLGIPSAEIRRRVDEALETVGMTEYAKLGPHQLSGGQKQRIAIAGILAMGPDCIVLDEPTAMLDPSGRDEVIDTVMRLNKENGITVILITHFMEEAVKADRVMVMDKGTVIMDGCPRNIFKEHDKMKALGLDVPSVTALAHTLRVHGIPMRPDIMTMQEFENDFYELYNSQLKKVPLTSTCDSHINDKIKINFIDVSAGGCIIEIEHLRHTYDIGTPFARNALEDINLSISQGEFIGIIGHTGSGKSTLIQHLNALLKPTSGRVILDGENIHADKGRLKTVRQRVGLVFQYPEHQLFEVSIYKDVAFGPANMGLSAGEIDSRVKEALRLVGLPEEIHEKSPFELSGGQKRRAAIAGVLAMKPDVLILDEPTAGLDPAGRDAILSQIAAMHKIVGNTVILVSHNMEDVSRLAGRIIVMSGGKIILTGTPSEIFAQPDELAAVGLAAPPIAVLMDRFRKQGLNIPPGIFTIEAAAEALVQNLRGSAPRF